MKVIRFLLKSLFIFTLFILGVSLADKEYLSERVVGLHIVGEAPQQITQKVCSLAESGQAINAGDLSSLINDCGFNAKIVCRSEYFESAVVDGMLIPAGVYETVCVTVGQESGQQHRQLVVTGDIGRSYQRIYISFLSLLGYAEKLINYLGNVL